MCVDEKKQKVAQDRSEKVGLLSQLLLFSLPRFLRFLLSMASPLLNSTRQSSSLPPSSSQSAFFSYTPPFLHGVFHLLVQ